jgi:hypothetical protein
LCQVVFNPHKYFRKKLLIEFQNVLNKNIDLEFCKDVYIKVVTQFFLKRQNFPPKLIQTPQFGYFHELLPCPLKENLAEVPSTPMTLV